ncbi:MAG: asparagine synthase (glutamine-hydrolyzing) [Nitrospirae bacterium]|nr:asparagine synthase (glutamine-hydrolyzing) [Nitrospirota bacterium]
MCGILGIFDNKRLNEGLLIQMRDTLVHRGPDDSGIWISLDKRIGLAHRRLSIIDLSEAGRQPMSDDEGRIWLTFNGEVYNFAEIREGLIDKGYKFKSHTDTEVIINAYKEWGTECLNKFNGMFAFGIYDDKKKIFFLARDRTGKKPLYYLSDGTGSRFYFASEIKAILEDRRVSKELDLKSLNCFFTYGYIPGEGSIFKGIMKLPPANALVYSIDTGQIKIWSYWDPPNLSDNSASEAELLEELEVLLQDSVKMRMVSDVPLGAFLSGGVDSSLIVAMMSRVADKPVKTFSIGFEDNAFNELPYARIVANHFGTEHHELIVKPDAFNILPELVPQFDEPFADSSMIPTYYVSKATREYVTVALSGDGGDELFGGYRHYLAALLHQRASEYLPSFIRHLAAGADSFLPEKGRALARRQLAKLRLSPNDAFVERSSDPYFGISSRSKLFSGETLDSLSNGLDEPELMLLALLEKRRGDFVNSMTYADMKTYLPDDVLVKVDRASMMVSLEVRAPLLDYRIADFSFGKVCGSLKVKRLTTKYLLKKLAKKILPLELDINRKQGFAIPISKWFRGPLKSDINDIILSGNDHILDRKYIARIIDEHGEGYDHSSRLFALLVFCLWERAYALHG